jgi:hypothetical protein
MRETKKIRVMKTKRNTDNDIKFLFKTTFDTGVTVYRSFHTNNVKQLIKNEEGWNDKNEELGIDSTTREQIVEMYNNNDYKIELLEKSCQKEIEKWGNKLIKNDPNTISTRIGKWNPVVVKPVVVKKYNRWGDVLVKTHTGEQGVTYFIDRKYGKALGLEKFMITCSTYGRQTNFCEVKKELEILD